MSANLEVVADSRACSYTYFTHGEWIRNTHGMWNSQSEIICTRMCAVSEKIRVELKIGRMRVPVRSREHTRNDSPTDRKACRRRKCQGEGGGGEEKLTSRFTSTWITSETLNSTADKDRGALFC